MNFKKIKRLRKEERGGAAMVEFALVGSLFFLMVLWIFEFARAFMVIQMMNTAVRFAGREGAQDGVTTEQVEENIIQTLDDLRLPGDDATVYILDMSGFDNGEDINIDPNDPDNFFNQLDDMMGKNYDPDDDTSTKYEAFPLNTAKARHLALVRVELPYDSVKLFSPFFLGGVTLSAQTIIRHE